MPRRMRLRDRIALKRLEAEENRRARIPPVAEPEIETALRRAGSIGGLERLAGIGSDPASRLAFWKPFARLPARESLDAGCAELRRLARELAASEMGVAA